MFEILGVLLIQQNGRTSFATGLTVRPSSVLASRLSQKGSHLELWLILITNSKPHFV